MRDNLEKRKKILGKPLILIPLEDRNEEWFKDMADYHINLTSFNGHKSTNSSRKHDMQIMYNVYNSQIPMEWFSHITDPLTAKDQRHKKFPAKIRPTNILRTNIDLLLGEWPRRPFKYRVENIGEEGYNSFVESLNAALEKNLTDRFFAEAQQQLMANGATEQELSQLTPDQIPLPQEVKKTFSSGYKDKQAIRGQKWINRTIVEQEIKRKLHKSFKDWNLVGEAYTYKGIHQGELVYERFSPMYIEWDGSQGTEFAEDAEWIVALREMTGSDVVNWFYDVMSEEDHKKIQTMFGKTTPSAMYSVLQGLYLDESFNRIPVYHIQFQGRKQIGYLTTTDPITGETVETVIDEAEFPTVEEGATLKKQWVNEGYEVWRVGDGGPNSMYFNMGPIQAQRNTMNNFSRNKLSYNGKRFSDTHSQNISIAQIGMPYLIMYIIVGRTLELTIAKSKGKILLIDKNAIPNRNGWTEEKFFYYSEALGYATLDRNQIGVDKSWNQYTVVDMSLFDQITQLIELQAHYKREWDDIIGINRQRKGQTFASDTNAANEAATFQSSVITDMIFAGFDEFVQREMQGLLDLSKFVIAAGGVRKLYNGADMDDNLMEIDPVPYCNADLGLFMQNINKSDEAPLELMKLQAQNMLQNGVSPSTMLEIFNADNVAELKRDLKEIERIQAEMEQQAAESEAERERLADERAMAFMEYEKMLEEQLINVEYDRKEDIEYLKATANTFTFQDGDSNDNGVPDAAEIMDQQTKRADIVSKERTEARKLAVQARLERMRMLLDDSRKEKEGQRKEKIEKQKNSVTLKAARIKGKSKPK